MHYNVSGLDFLSCYCSKKERIQPPKDWLKIPEADINCRCLMIKNATSELCVCKVESTAFPLVTLGRPQKMYVVQSVVREVHCGDKDDMDTWSVSR